MTIQTATLTGISTVAIAVTDQDATKRLSRGVGFETRFDADVIVGFPWIDMAAPGGRTTLSVVATTDALPTGIDTGIRFVTHHARAAHARLVDLGLRVGDLVDRPTAPLMFEFRDLDGKHDVSGRAWVSGQSSPGRAGFTTRVSPSVALQRRTQEY